MFTNWTHHILLIDDSPSIRSVMARQIMMHANQSGKTCAIFRLGERAEPSLTYLGEPEGINLNPIDHVIIDFAVYEASSPRHALTWIQHAWIKNLTIVSDVLMPTDTEVGLPGLIEGLYEMKLPVNLLFMSSETQSRDYIKSILSHNQAYFLIKGSDVWTRLPQALVQGSSRFTYKVLNKPDTEQHFGAPYTKATIHPKPVVMTTAVVHAPVQTTELEEGQPEAKPAKPAGFWGKLLHLFSKNAVAA